MNEEHREELLRSSPEYPLDQRPVAGSPQVGLDSTAPGERVQPRGLLRLDSAAHALELGEDESIAADGADVGESLRRFCASRECGTCASGGARRVRAPPLGIRVRSRAGSRRSLRSPRMADGADHLAGRADPIARAVRRVAAERRHVVHADADEHPSVDLGADRCQESGLGTGAVTGHRAASGCVPPLPLTPPQTPKGSLGLGVGLTTTPKSSILGVG